MPDKDENEEVTYIFKGPVNGFKGVGRFIMGLIDEVVVVNPRALKDYLYDLLCLGVERLNPPKS